MRLKCLAAAGTREPGTVTPWWRAKVRATTTVSNASSTACTPCRWNGDCRDTPTWPRSRTTHEPRCRHLASPPTLRCARGCDRPRRSPRARAAHRERFRGVLAGGPQLRHRTPAVPRLLAGSQAVQVPALRGDGVRAPRRVSAAAGRGPVLAAQPGPLGGGGL